mmetsp:Transcript_2244/g.2189  ORF Transcript_2244/g.2189 Transcript_2244/m.2189 type:complete len:147 (+) Transcript_2244:40-480(+)
MSETYEKLLKYSKLFQVIGAIALLVLFIFRIVVIRYASSLAVWVISIYYLPLAAMIICVEVGVERVKKLFFFMNFMWGKGILNLVLGCMGITGYYILEIPIALFFFATAGIYFVLFFCYKEQERELAETKNAKNLEVELPPGGLGV